MKRTIVCILMTVVLILSLLVPVGAGHVTDRVTKTVPLWNADETWGDRYTLDTENQTEGEGCISINLNGVTGTHAPYKKLDSIDATGMLALEFDIYISDLAILDHLQSIASGSIEICSGGNYDQGEKNYDLAAIARDVQNGCPKVGWNRVIILLKDMSETKGEYGSFDLSHINYLRIYWTGMTDCGQDWILKFDNFVLTDREVAPDPHTPGEWQYDENKHWRYCTECDKKIHEGIHTEYSHPPYHCEKEFTCYACKQVCGPYEHEFTVKDTASRVYLAEWVTCTRGALFYYGCARCGERSEETFEFGEPRGHDLTEGYISCDDQGHSMYCRNCKEYVNIIPHNFDEWVTVREATETESGLQKRGCMMCSYVETQELTYVAPEQPNKPETPQTPEPIDKGARPFFRAVHWDCWRSFRRRDG